MSQANHQCWGVPQPWLSFAIAASRPWKGESWARPGNLVLWVCLDPGFPRHMANLRDFMLGGHSVGLQFTKMSHGQPPNENCLFVFMVGLQVWQTKNHKPPKDLSSQVGRLFTGYLVCLVGSWNVWGTTSFYLVPKLWICSTNHCCHQVMGPMAQQRLGTNQRLVEVFKLQGWHGHITPGWFSILGVQLCGVWT